MTIKNMTSRSLIATVGLVLLAISLLSVTVALADTLVYDGDILTAGTQTTVSLGNRTPGEEISQTIEVKLICDTKNHADRGTTVTVQKGPASSVPAGGALSMGSVVFTIPNDWPLDTAGSGTNCASPAETLTATTPVTITAPSSPGSYTYELALDKSVSDGAPGHVKDPNPPKLTFTLTIPAPSDTTPPTITCTVPSQTVWSGTDVTVPCTASDSGSGLANSADASFDLTTSVAAGTETASALTTSRTVCDNAANCATAGPYTFKVDKKAPVVSCGSADNIWHATDQSVTCTATDSGSGLANSADASFDLTTSVAANVETNSAYTNSKAVLDAVGNSTTAGPVGPFKIDKKPPSITLTTPSDGATYTLKQAAAANYSCADDGSGVASCSGPVPNGSNIDTGSVGAKTFTVTATDNAGNTTTETTTYYVAYAFGGILQPINADGSSIFKLGSTIPVKFQLRDAHGNFVTNAVAKIYVKKISNGVNGTVWEDAVSTSAATTGNFFRYDYTSNQYIFNLATKPLSAGTWQIRIELDDGTSRSVDISLR